MIDISSTSARYNWWTPEHQKQDISPLTQLATIMQYGDAREVFEVFRGYNEELLTQAYSRIAGDIIWVKQKRHAYIRSLLTYSQSHPL